MDAFRMALALGFPWLTGIVWLRFRWRHAPAGAWPLAAGYGYVAGILLTTALLRILDAFGLELGFWKTALVLGALSGIGLILTHDVPWRDWSGGVLSSEWRRQRAWQKTVFVVLAGALLARYAGLALEIVWRPLYAWDAWATWAPKARVWYELGSLVPFVDWSTWLARGPGEAYTLAAHHYPPTVPLIQVWTSLGLGRWDDAVMNLPWLFCAAALGLAFYGQARIWGASPLLSLVFVYLLLSLPLLNVHVALAGNADLWLGTIYGLAAMAFLQWVKSGSPRQGLLAVGLAVACTQIKVPGLLWMLSFLPAVLVARAPRKFSIFGALSIAVAGGVLLLWGGLRPGEIALPYLGAYELRFRPEAGLAFFENYFSLANWHLLGYFFTAVLLWRLPRLLGRRLFLSLGVLVGAGFAFLLGVYVFSSQAAFALDFTQINRATLHVVPLVCFAALVLVHEPADRKPLPHGDAASS